MKLLLVCLNLLIFVFNPSTYSFPNSKTQVAWLLREHVTYLWMKKTWSEEISAQETFVIMLSFAFKKSKTSEVILKIYFYFQIWSMMKFCQSFLVKFWMGNIKIIRGNIKIIRGLALMIGTHSDFFFDFFLRARTSSR